jgi:hypothetical protein
MYGLLTNGRMSVNSQMANFSQPSPTSSLFGVRRLCHRFANSTPNQITSTRNAQIYGPNPTFFSITANLGSLRRGSNVGSTFRAVKLGE